MAATTTARNTESDDDGSRLPYVADSESDVNAAAASTGSANDPAMIHNFGASMCLRRTCSFVHPRFVRGFRLADWCFKLSTGRP